MQSYPKLTPQQYPLQLCRPSYPSFKRTRKRIKPTTSTKTHLRSTARKNAGMKNRPLPKPPTYNHLNPHLAKSGVQERNIGNTIHNSMPKHYPKWRQREPPPPLQLIIPLLTRPSTFKRHLSTYLYPQYLNLVPLLASVRNTCHL